VRDINIRNRVEIEAFYPVHDFEHEASLNSISDRVVTNGVLILSELDDHGFVRLARARRHVAEADPEGDTVFVAPMLVRTTDAAIDCADTKRVLFLRRETYRLFIDGLIEAVRGARFKSPIGKGEDRLVGFHGG
jgi:hypothetical protein